MCLCQVSVILILLSHGHRMAVFSLAQQHDTKTLAIGRVGAQAYNQMRRNNVFPSLTKVLLSDFWKSSGFKPAREELMGSITRNLAVATSSDKTDKDWDSTLRPDYADRLSKQTLVHTHLKSTVEQRTHGMPS